jgi:F420-dependent oxidoreductase-like protein
MIGVYVQEPNPRKLVDTIRDAEKAGVPAFWLTMGGTASDVAVLYGAAAMVTERIKLGTSIIPTWPKHPIALVQQAVALNALAPGRFRLGIGPSHHTGMREMFGFDYARPLTNLREYLTVLTQLLHRGQTDFEGHYVKAHATLPQPVDVPVMASALQPGSFLLCGELSDGAISWVAPWNYLRDTALPAMREGAAMAGRPVPPLIAHTPVYLGTNREDMLERSRKMLGRYATLPNYQGMMRKSGFEQAASGADMAPYLEALVVHGSDDHVVEGLKRILAEGAGEIIAHPVYGEDAERDAIHERLFDVVAEANRVAGTAG